MEPTKNAILFSGGKLILAEPSKAGVEEGLKMSRNDADGSWTIQVTATISKEQAENSIFKFSDLKKDPHDETLEESNPNMPFFTALDDNGKPHLVKIASNSTIFPFYFREKFGSITLKLNFENFGKTQNPKTQNAHN